MTHMNYPTKIFTEISALQTAITILFVRLLHSTNVDLIGKLAPSTGKLQQQTCFVGNVIAIQLHFLLT